MESWAVQPWTWSVAQPSFRKDVIIGGDHGDIFGLSEQSRPKSLMGRYADRPVDIRLYNGWLLSEPNVLDGSH